MTGYWLHFQLQIWPMLFEWNGAHVIFTRPLLTDMAQLNCLLINLTAWVRPKINSPLNKHVNILFDLKSMLTLSQPI